MRRKLIYKCHFQPSAPFVPSVVLNLSIWQLEELSGGFFLWNFCLNILLELLLWLSVKSVMSRWTRVGSRLVFGRADRTLGMLPGAGCRGCWWIAEAAGATLSRDGSCSSKYKKMLLRSCNILILRHLRLFEKAFSLSWKVRLQSGSALQVNIWPLICPRMEYYQAHASSLRLYFGIPLCSPCYAPVYLIWTHTVSADGVILSLSWLCDISQSKLQSCVDCIQLIRPKNSCTDIEHCLFFFLFFFFSMNVFYWRVVYIMVCASVKMNCAWLSLYLYIIFLTFI